MKLSSFSVILVLTKTNAKSIFSLHFHGHALIAFSGEIRQSPEYCDTGYIPWVVGILLKMLQCVT